MASCRRIRHTGVVVAVGRVCSFVFNVLNVTAFLERPGVIFFSTEMERGMGGAFERDFARNEMGMSRSFGEPPGRGMGKKAPWAPRGRGPPLGLQAARLPDIALCQGSYLGKVCCFSLGF